MNQPSSSPIVTTIGEPGGIGPDIALALWRDRAASETPPFALLADPDHLAGRARHLGIEAPIRPVERPLDAISTFASALPVLPLRSPLSAAPGRLVESDASGVVEAIKEAVRLIAAGDAASMVTLPINKKSLYDAGFDYPGHTEFLAELARREWALDAAPLSVMMIAGPDLRTVPVTIHDPLADVPRILSADLVERTIRIVERDMRERFGYAKPRIAVAGLNPHAGEEGTIGSEDEAMIRPVLDGLRGEGLEIAGPLPADTMFHAEARARYDVAVCMYHDQALIPAKTLAFDEGVNVTLGLPFVRTSPDHGTALDIAGRGIARPDSTLAALRMARDMSARLS